MNLVDLLERGAHITLGTDFLTHDIWEVMRTTYAELKQSTRSEHFGASHVWGMATKAAAPIASASGYQGTIAVGAPADLLFVEDSLALSPLIETPGFSNVAYNTLIHTRPSMIKHVMLGGRWIIQEGRCLTIDETALEMDYADILQSVLSDKLVDRPDRI
jgi:5-methylthioadenosine/S-adenosylhomocysteine deaminase